MTLLPIARPLRAPDARAWQTLLFLLGGLRDHGADDAALVPGLHLRHGLPHPGAGLGAGRVRPGAGAASVSRGAVAIAAGGDRLLRRGPRPRPGGPVLQPPLHRSRPLPPGRRAEGRPTPSPASSTTSGSGSPARARSSSASTASTAPTSTTTSSTSASAGRTAPTAWPTHLPAVPPPDQRRRIRLPDHEPVHEDAPGRLLVPGLRLGEERPGAGTDHRRAEDITPQPDYVFKVKGKLDPAGCGAKKS